MTRLTGRIISIIMIAIMLFPASARALSQAQTDVLNSGSYYYDVNPDNATICGTPLPVSGPPGGSTAALVWPFATKDASQYNRVDQGWDIQSTAGAAIYAIAPGAIHVFNTDSGGFGNDYPTEQLDSSIGGPSSWVYYGHVHVLSSVVGKHVSAGQQIAVANTTDPQNGSAAPPGWLEIGFAIPNTDAPIATGYEGGATPPGQTMHDLLIKATPSGGTSTPTDSTTGNSQTDCCDSTGGGATDGTGAIEQLMRAIASHESHGDPTANSGNGAYGKYQFTPPTWKSDAQKYYPPALQYSSNPANAPEEIQDALAYLVMASLAIKGYNAFQIAVSWYYPAALNPDGTLNPQYMHNPPPYPGNTQGVGDFGNQMEDWMLSGVGRDGQQLSSIPIKDQQAPDFETWVNKLGKPVPTLKIVKYGDDGKPISGSSTTLSGTTPTTTCTPGPGTPAGNFVFYEQCDGPWADHPIYTGYPRTVCTSGCGPTSAAMVVATLADKSVTPDKTGDYMTSLGNGIGFADGGATSEGLIKAVEHWGLKATLMGIDTAAAKNVLSAGGFVIVGGQGSHPYSADGHVIVLRGVDTNGNFLIGNPSLPLNDNSNDTAYSPQTIQAGAIYMIGVTK